MNNVALAIEVLLIVLILAANLYYILCMVAAIRFFSKPNSISNAETEPVTILIPLFGADFEAYENYSSFCKQNYPQYQIVFGVQDSNDASIPIVQKLMNDNPDCDIALSISSETIGMNSKVSNLQNMFAQVKFDRIVIVDSDIRVGKEYLQNIVSEFENQKVGLVTCLYRGTGAINFASKMEAIGITSEFASGVLVAKMLEGIRFALGATLGTNRQILQRIGGFQTLADYLADDFMLGNIIAKFGYEVRLSHYVVETVLGPVSFLQMLKHQIRWARGTRICRPKGYIGLLFTYGILPATVFVIVSGASVFSWWLLAITFFLRFLASWVIGVRGLKDPVLKNYFWLVPIREILSSIIWLISLFGKTVEWRGKSLQLLKDGRVKILQSKT